MADWLAMTRTNARNYRAALFAGFIGGNIASFVKWGTENPLPARAMRAVFKDQRASSPARQGTGT
ncbi:hypothetical protein R6Y99_03415 [Pseudomonas lundensis]|uniref:hypothetical protein n=1 Tax=Serratia proteamaculans TaxID=28151 RepID=UPI0029822FE7|nr:hypothetical protein [Serratia proteamaculans]MDW5498850.1 hypothetical protein [Serratia proteamaculans]MDW5503907.1 hypothetical protein [Pseudomonas lundensis]